MATCWIPGWLLVGCYPWMATCWMLPLDGYLLDATPGWLLVGCYPWMATCWMLPLDGYLLDATPGWLLVGCYPWMALDGPLLVGCISF